MSDLISTQDAVAKVVDTAIRNVLSGEQKLTKEYEQSVKEAVNVILDTAKRTDGDLISRQAAIDAHCEICGDRGRCNSDICPDVEVFQLLPSAQPEQSIAQERYEDLCEYFKDCSDQGRIILNDRKEFKSWLDRMKWHVMECNKLERELEKFKSAQPQYEELTPEEAAPEIASGSILRTSYWLDIMIALKQMGYAICRKKG